MTLEDFQNGQVLLVDKPLRWTSFQIVNKLRWAIKKHFRIKAIKVGHAGTLDPLATGLLVLCTGKKTKQINTIQAEKKEYTGTITLGSTTPSFDLETNIDKRFPTGHITKDLIMGTAQGFLGTQEQFPPIFSAVKQNGKRLYDLARAGKSTNLNPRQITIDNFEILKIEGLKVDFRVVCSKGTYIRSLAHDFGKALRSGAHLSALRRTRSGSFHVDNALSVEQWIEILTKP